MRESEIWEILVMVGCNEISLAEAHALLIQVDLEYHARKFADFIEENNGIKISERIMEDYVRWGA